jgi:hypothetical protein
MEKTQTPKKKRTGKFAKFNSGMNSKKNKDSTINIHTTEKPKILTPELKILRNKKALLIGMEKFRCFVSKATKFAGVDRSTFYDYYRDDPDFKKACDDLTECKIDEMENHLERKIPVDTVANIYWLKVKGRKRGWNERITINSEVESFQFPESVVANAVTLALKAELERLKG